MEKGNEMAGPQDHDDQAFFITEDIRPDQFQDYQSQQPIKEENESEHEAKAEKEDEEDQEEFDFGKAKMEFFKKRAREILMDENDLEYDGVPMPLSGAYKSLKVALKNISVVYGNSENKPHYMKTTFTQGR